VTTPFLRLAGVTKRYGGGGGIEDVSLDVSADESVVVVGPSGSGKTTLLRLVAGLERPDAILTSFLAANSSGSRLRARSLGRRNCSCWTSHSPASTATFVCSCVVSWRLYGVSCTLQRFM
jgi:ABC-type phosphate/phosphonate transport system ATPase subunit